MLPLTRAMTFWPIFLALVIACAPVVAKSPARLSIRDIDFRNFTFNWYPYWCDTPSTGRKIILKDGRMETGFDYGKEPRTFYLIDDGVRYGDLTGDGKEEAVVVLWIVTSGTARDGVVFVYTLSTGKPKRLFAFETGDRWDYGYHSAFINNGELVVERYKPYLLLYQGQKHNMSSSSFYVRDHYKWTVRRFRKTKSQVVPVDSNDRAPWAHRI